jgi:hypothetical protein
VLAETSGTVEPLIFTVASETPPEVVDITTDCAVVLIIAATAIPDDDGDAGVVELFLGLHPIEKARRAIINTVKNFFILSSFWYGLTYISQICPQ